MYINNIKKIFTILSVFLFFWSLASAQWFDITNYEIKWDIKTDWTIDINENIDVNFYTSMHGIERIFERYYTIDDMIFQVFYNNLNVNWDKFTTYEEYWDLVARIWDKDILVNWKHTYNIDYSIYWLIRNFSWKWYSELYWNVIGYEWDSNINKTKIELTLPKQYTWFVKEDFLISTGYSDYSSIDDFDWELTRDENKIYITYNWNLSPKRWITLAIKFPNDYFEYDHDKQASLFVEYTQDFKISESNLLWKVHKDWTVDFTNNYELKILQPISYLYWKIPFKYRYEYTPYMFKLNNLKINGKDIESKEYDTTEYEQFFNLDEFSWSSSIDVNYSTYWFIRPFTWEFDDWKYRIYLQLPIFSLNSMYPDTNVTLEFPESEFSDICSWVYKDDFNIIIGWESFTAGEFYDKWWFIWCENNIVEIIPNWLFDDHEVFITINLTETLDFNLNEELLWALKTIWDWKFYFNNKLNNIPSIVFLLAMLLFWWWFTKYMNDRYKKYWKSKPDYIVQYNAPEWIDAPEAWIIIDEKLDSRDITALIYEWAANWYIEICSDEEKKNKFYIKKLKKLNPNAKKYQMDLFNSLFSKWNIFKFSEESSAFNRYLSTAWKELAKYIDEKKWYSSSFSKLWVKKTEFKNWTTTRIFWTCVWWLIAYCWIVTLINQFLLPVWSWIKYICWLWIALFIATYRNKDKDLTTKKWEELQNHLLWYKQFLVEVDKDKIEELTKEDPLFVEKSLPYAVVFWIETQFIKKITPDKLHFFDWDFDKLLSSIKYIGNTATVEPYWYRTYTPRSYSSWSSYSYSSSSWHSSWSSFSWWYSSWWGWGWGGWRWW